MAHEPKSYPPKTDRFRGCLLGLACGDAVGTTVEFRARGTFRPVTDMVGGGPFGLKSGEWTDDTSMALCLGTSLVESRGFDPVDQMERYCRWWKEGYLSSNGYCFDIGMTTSQALNGFLNSSNPFSGVTDSFSAGNGSLMRLAPVPMFFYPDVEESIHFAGESSRTTHGAQECVDACRLFASMLISALDGQNKDEILFETPFREKGFLSPKIQAIADGMYRGKDQAEISGSGYVVESLEAALWSFYTTDSFGDAILRAVNLGDDADTTAAVTGQIAGAFYGETGIPSSWLEKLVMREEIGLLAEGLFRSNGYPWVPPKDMTI